ncbi:MAG: hypothetical protein HZA05_02150 [Nitrospirae bacterium]|nr:hypothetical protein [Nitrospirota bacterium]
MKKWTLILVSTLILIASAHPASAMYNRFTTAQSLNQGQMESGISAGYGDDGDYNYKYAYLYPYLKYGLGYLLEIEGKAGVISVDKESGGDDIGVLLGFEIKYQIIKETKSIPIDIAIVGGYTGHIIDLQSLHEFDFAALVSKTFDVNKFKITPYGGPEITYTNGSYAPEGKADIFGILGASFAFTENLSAGAELKLGTDWATGVNLKIRF